jgi:hypothetical protein
VGFFNSRGTQREADIQYPWWHGAIPMRIAICHAPSIGDTYGQHARYTDELRVNLSRRSIQAEILQYPSDTFFPTLYAYLSDPDSIVHFNAAFYDLLMQAAGIVIEGPHAFDSCPAVTMATIGDHPFSYFMQYQIGRAHAKTRFVVIDATFIDEMQTINPKLSASTFLHLPNFPITRDAFTRPLGWTEREYDVAIPLKIIDPAGGNIARFLEVLGSDPTADVVAATYETVVSDLSRNPFTVFRQILLERRAIDLAEVQAKDIQTFQKLLNMIGVTDNIVSQARRNRMLSSLLRATGDLRVVVTSAPMPWLDVGPHVEFIGEGPAHLVAALVANSKTVVNCSPTYPNSVHERIYYGMASGTAVITDESPQLRKTFTRDEYVPHDWNATKTLSEIFETIDLEKIAAAGALQVNNDRAFSWDFHIDRLLELARR